jgi:hypothetical protein
VLTVVPGDGSGHEGGKDHSRRWSMRSCGRAPGGCSPGAAGRGGCLYRGIRGRAELQLPPPGRRNGYHQPREVLTSAGAIEVPVPRVDDMRQGSRPVPRGEQVDASPRGSGRRAGGGRLRRGLPGCGLMSRRDLSLATARLGGLAVRSWRDAS